MIASKKACWILLLASGLIALPLQFDAAAGPTHEKEEKVAGVASGARVDLREGRSSRESASEKGLESIQQVVWLDKGLVLSGNTQPPSSSGQSELKAGSGGGNPEVRAHRLKGIDYFNNGQYEEAVKEFTRVIELSPKDATAFRNRGDSYHSMGLYDQAILDYSRSIELDPNNVTVYDYRGETYALKRQFDLAIADFTQANKLNPYWIRIYLDRAEAYREKGQYDLALSDYAKALQIKPSSAEIYNGRGLLYIVMLKYKDAISDLSKAIELDEHFTLAYVNRGAAYIHTGLYDQAIVDLNRAIQIDPRSAIAYNNRGAAYIRKGQCDQAIQDLNKALELDPKIGKSYEHRAFCYYSKRHYDKAWKDVQSAQALGFRVDPEFLDKLRTASNDNGPSASTGGIGHSREIEGLVERLNESYRGTLQYHWPDGSLWDNGYIIRTRSIALGNDSTLLQDYQWCRIVNPLWRSDGYVMSAQSLNDCENNRSGLKWEEKREQSPLKQIAASSVRVAAVDEGYEGENLAVSFDYVDFDPKRVFMTGKHAPGFLSIRCRDRNTCNRMAADFRRLLEAYR